MTTDAIERRRRDLESAARRLRVAAMSDPQRTEELADVVVELTASALLLPGFMKPSTWRCCASMSWPMAAR